MLKHFKRPLTPNSDGRTTAKKYSSAKREYHGSKHNSSLDKLGQKTLVFANLGWESIPHTPFQNTFHIVNLDVSGNKLRKISPFLVNQLPSLQSLNVARNELICLNYNIGDWKHLRKINAQNNKITFLESSISKLQKLVYLNLANNPLTPTILNIVAATTRWDARGCREFAHEIQKLAIKMPHLKRKVFQPAPHEKTLGQKDTAIHEYTEAVTAISSAYISVPSSIMCLSESSDPSDTTLNQNSSHDSFVTAPLLEYPVYEETLSQYLCVLQESSQSLLATEQSAISEKQSLNVDAEKVKTPTFQDASTQTSKFTLSVTNGKSAKSFANPSSHILRRSSDLKQKISCQKNQSLLNTKSMPYPSQLLANAVKETSIPKLPKNAASFEIVALYNCKSSYTVSQQYSKIENFEPKQRSLSLNNIPTVVPNYAEVPRIVNGKKWLYYFRTLMLWVIDFAKVMNIFLCVCAGILVACGGIFSNEIFSHVLNTGVFKYILPGFFREVIVAAHNSMEYICSLCSNRFPIIRIDPKPNWVIRVSIYLGLDKLINLTIQIINKLIN